MTTRRTFNNEPLSRRGFLTACGGAAAALAAPSLVWSDGRSQRVRGSDREPLVSAPQKRKALVCITLDLEMSRNFPTWERTHWDYEKGNLDAATKRYTVDACRRVKKRGGVIHNFVVGRVFEQEDIEWLKEIAAEGHPIGNHTYDHVNVLSTTRDQIQFRFKRAPWLIRGKSIDKVIRDNIEMCEIALRERGGIKRSAGFRTPGGFHAGLSGREDVQKMLREIGFTWVSSKYPAHPPYGRNGKKPTQEMYDAILKAQSEAQPFVYPGGLVEIPMSPISDITAFRGGRWRLEWFMKAIRDAVEQTIDRGEVYDFLAHPSCLGVVDPEFRTIDMICDLVEAAGERAEIVGLDAFVERARAVKGT